MTYELRIDGPAEGKGRPRFFKGRVFSPRDRYGFTDKIQSTARAEHIEKIEGPVALAVYIHRAIPKSASKKRRAQIDMTWCSAKPDIDNVFKSVMDALNGSAWHDDTQVARISGGRWWSQDSYTVICIQSLQEEK